VSPPPLDFTVPFTSMRYTALLEKVGYDEMVRTLDGDAAAEVAHAASEISAPTVVAPAESSS